MDCSIVLMSPIKKWWICKLTWYIIYFHDTFSAPLWKQWTYHSIDEMSYIWCSDDDYSANNDKCDDYNCSDYDDDNDGVDDDDDDDDENDDDNNDDDDDDNDGDDYDDDHWVINTK